MFFPICYEVHIVCVGVDAYTVMPPYIAKGQAYVLFSDV